MSALVPTDARHAGVHRGCSRQRLVTARTRDVTPRDASGPTPRHVCAACGCSQDAATRPSRARPGAVRGGLGSGPGSVSTAVASEVLGRCRRPSAQPLAVPRSPRVPSLAGEQGQGDHRLRLLPKPTQTRHHRHASRAVPTTWEDGAAVRPPRGHACLSPGVAKTRPFRPVLLHCSLGQDGFQPRLLAPPPGHTRSPGSPSHVPPDGSARRALGRVGTERVAAGLTPELSQPLWGASGPVPRRPRLDEPAGASPGRKREEGKEPRRGPGTGAGGTRLSPGGAGP